MSIVTRIYAIKPTVTVDEKYGEVVATIKFNNKSYIGTAVLHNEDAEFFSSKVGRTIAISKLRSAILKDEARIAKQEWQYKKQMYQEATKNKEPADVDPYGAFEHNMKRAYYRYENLRQAMKNEDTYRREYIEAQAKALDSIRYYRNKANNK